ncbi:Ubiquitin specific peptidase like 1 [Mactra antiquata]
MRMQVYKHQKCPQCLRIGISSQLQTYQINLEEAIVLCENNECTYPLGEVNGKSRSETFQRNFSDIKRYTNDARLLEVQHTLQNKVVSHLKKNGHKLQNDDIGIQTGSSRGKKKPKSSQSWRKLHSSSTTTITSDSSNFDKFNSFTNETNRHTETRYDTKTWSACTGSDGASDRESSNSSQDGTDTANQNHCYFTNIQSINSCSKSTHYDSFQFNKVTNTDCNHTLNNVVLNNVTNENIASQSNCAFKPLTLNSINNEEDNADVLKQEQKKVHVDNDVYDDNIKTSSSIIDAETVKHLKLTFNIPTGRKQTVVNYKSSKQEKCITVNNNANIELNTNTTRMNVMSKIFPQWRNCDALCWLDVILCLAVHNETLKNVVLHKTVDTSNIMYRLVRAHQQAYCLINQCTNKSCEHIQTVDSDIVTNTMKSTQHNLCDNIIAQCNTTSNNLNTSMSAQILPCDSRVKTSSPVELHHSSSPTCPSPLAVDNKSMGKVCNILNDIREEVWKKLYTRLKCAKGKPESPVFAFPLLLSESTMVENLFRMEYRFIYKCRQCQYEESSHHTNILPTLPALPENFCINIPQHIKTCTKCGNTQDTRILQYKKLPECFLMHFTEGLPHTKFKNLQLCYHGNNYTVTGVVEYKRSPDHFVAWLRNPADNKWMECDDLRSMFCRYKSDQPSFPSKQVHIVMWERCNMSKHTTDNTCNLTSPYCQSSNGNLTNKKLPDSLVEYFGGEKLKLNDVKSYSKKSRKLDISLSSSSSCTSSLSTGSSDCLHLPNFVSLAPLISCDLLKPQPRLHTISSSINQELTKLSSSSERISKTTLYTELSNCHIEGEKMALKPSSVFHTVKSMHPKNNVSVIKRHNPSSSITICNDTPSAFIDNETCQHEVDINDINDGQGHEDFAKGKQKMTMSTDNGKVDKSSSDEKCVKTLPSKNHEIVSNEYVVNNQEKKLKIVKESALSDRKTKTKKVSAGAIVFRKANFKLPTSGKKSSISKDAFFTLDPKCSKPGETGFNSKDESTTNSSCLNGDVSVLNSVKQYLLSRTTDRSTSKYKFKGMDLKTCSRESSCSEFELPRTSSGNSCGAVLSSGSTPGSVMTLSSSKIFKGYDMLSNKPELEGVNTLKRKLDDVIQSDSNRKTKLFKIYNNDLIKHNVTSIKDLNQSNKSCTSIYNDNMKENLTVDKNSDVLHSSKSRSDKCIFQIDDNKYSFLDMETKSESRNNDIDDSKTETSILHDLYDALNIPYNTIQESLSEFTDVQDILDSL